MNIISFSQISFEKGYFVLNSGKRITCLIKNIDWKNNPSSFEYKLTNSSRTAIKTIKNVKEFGIYNFSKYTRLSVAIDRSSNNKNHPSTTRQPSYVKDSLQMLETVFLSVLVEGSATLYEFKDDNLRKYFFSVNGERIEPLINKFYILENKLLKNESYKYQLLKALQCKSIPQKRIKRVNYLKKGLIKLFTDFNNCKNNESTDYESVKKRDLFNFSLKLSLSNSSLAIHNNISSFGKLDFKNEFGFKVGLETEFIMPFNRNKWALIFEPTYQSYKTKREWTYLQTDVIVRKTDIIVDYSSIEFPVGIRYYSFINDKSKMFYNISAIYDFLMPSSTIYAVNRRDLIDIDPFTLFNFSVGLGYKYTNKYSVELRFNTNRDLTNNLAIWDSEYKSISILLGYSLF